MTPAGRVGFITCSYFQREMRAALDSADFSDTVCGFFSARCCGDAREGVFSLPLEAVQGCAHVHILAGACADGLQTTPLPPGITLHPLGSCYELFIPAAMAENLLSQGAFLVTPGFLENWPENLPEKSLRRTAANHRKVVLLDTIPTPGTAENLHRFAEALKLPAETLPTGLDHLRLLLENLALADRAADAARAAQDLKRQSEIHIAEFTRTLNVINDLTASASENQAVELMLKLFTDLFQPGYLAFYPVSSAAIGAPRTLSSQGADPGILAVLLAWLPQQGDWKELDGGCILRLSHNSDTLGFLAVHTLASPDQASRHRETALQIARVCALTISNQRTFQKLLASQKMADLGSLAAGVAYEINSPLQVITGMSDSVFKRYQKERDESLLRDRLETIKRNAWRVASITRSLITYTGNSPQSVELSDLNDIVRDTLLLSEHQLGYMSNVAIRTELEPGMPPLPCDRNKVSQALLNLISNSQDAMPGGGVIIIRTMRAAGTAGSRHQILTVADNGDGIPQDLQPRIFDPFFTTRPAGKGIGLGLSIVQGIMEAHHGRIDFESTPGKGSTFNLAFQEARADAPS